MKKAYTAPEVRTEKVELGVFGCYGSTGGFHHEGRRSWWRWFWRGW